MSGSVQVNITRGISSTVPPVAFQKTIGAWPVINQTATGKDGVQKDIQICTVDPVALGYTEWSKYDVSVNNLGEGSILARFKKENGGDGPTAVIQKAQMPQTLSMDAFRSVTLSCASGQMMVYFNIVGTVERYSLNGPDHHVASSLAEMSM